MSANTPATARAKLPVLHVPPIGWTAGLALCMIYINSRISDTLHITGVRSEFFQCAIIGLIFPALACLLKRYQSSVPENPIANVIPFFFGIIALLSAFAYGFIAGNYSAFLLSFIEIVVFAFLGRKRIQALRTSGDISGVADVALSFGYVAAVCCAGWTAAKKIMWWQSFTDHMGSDLFFDIVLVIASLIICYALSQNTLSNKKKRWIDIVITTLAVVAFFGLSCRKDGLFPYNGMSIGHWGVWTSPAIMVRQGGLLLWDVPSQYGFLSILTLASMPHQTVWEGLYLLNGLAQFAVALILFLSLSIAMRGPFGALASAVISISAVYIIIGAAWKLGQETWPSVGGYRFIWCYILIYLLLKQYAGKKSYSRRHTTILLGMAIWLISTLWSVESAFYTTAIWFPSVAALAYAGSADGSSSSFKTGLKSAAQVIAFHVVFFLLAVGLISLGYISVLGHPPDYYAYFDYALSNGSGFFSSPLDPIGSVWVLLSCMCYSSHCC